MTKRIGGNMESNTKIIFFDIDGTLIDMKRKQISGKTMEMLIRLKEKGVMICIATGRAPSALPAFGDIVFDVYLTFNGSYCYNRDQIIFSNPLLTDDVDTIIKNAETIHRPLSLATKDRQAANGKDDDLVEYYGFANREVEVADDFEEVAKEEVYQIMLGCRERDHLSLLNGVHRAKIAAWWDRAVDIIPADGGKGIGIEKVLEYYHLNQSEAMAFGDGNNDIEMFQAVGKGIAMANASDRLKEAAYGLCGDAAEDGIYHYCLEHGLI